MRLQGLNVQSRHHHRTCEQQRQNFVCVQYKCLAQRHASLKEWYLDISSKAALARVEKRSCVGEDISNFPTCCDGWQKRKPEVSRRVRSDVKHQDREPDLSEQPSATPGNRTLRWMPQPWNTNKVANTVTVLEIRLLNPVQTLLVLGSVAEGTLVNPPIDGCISNLYCDYLPS